jgi:putative membrane-bound dehydrogenase-like protein
VQRSLPALVIVLTLALAPLAGQQKLDLNQQQSPPKPRPEWLKLVDQGASDPRLKGYLAPEGVKVEIVAEEPTVINPVGMTFGPDGTLYVLEWVPAEGAHFPESFVVFTYKDGSKRKVAIMRKPVKDRVSALSFNPVRKVYDKVRKVLDEELPSSILIHDDWMYLTGQGTVRRYKLADLGEGKKPKAEVIAHGFCGFHHHQVSGLTIGNDGWLYVTSGDDDNFAEGSDGSRATVLRTGAVFRCRPDGSKLHTFALGFRNPYRDVALDETYNVFHVDNDNEDGSKFTGCRLMHVAEGNDFGWRLRHGARCCVPDRVRGAAFGELPGKVTPLLKTGRGAPAGLLIYNDTRFPEQFRGLLYYPDVVRKLIRAYRVEPRGASFEVTEEFEFLKSNDPLFRPCQMVLGPDGAMYVCDWRTDSGGAGRLWGDGKHGRIYRLTWAGTKDDPAIAPRTLDSWAKIGKLSDAELFKTLSSEDFSDRERARNEIVRRGVKGRAPLLKLLKDDETPLRARIAALGALQSFWNDDVQKAVLELLHEPVPDLRRLAADGLALNAKAGDKEVHEALVQLVNDQDRAARRAVLLAIGKLGAPGAEDVLVNALQFDESKDEYLRDGIVRAIEQTGKRGIDAVLALMDSGVQAERDRAVEAFLAFRTRPGALALPTLLKNRYLRGKQRAEVLRSYGNYLLDPPISLEPLLDELARGPDSAALLTGLEVLSVSGALKGPKAEAVLLKALDEGAALVRLAAIKAVGDTRLVKAAPRLAELLKDATKSGEERLALATALTVVPEKSAVPLLRTLATDRKENASLRGQALRALSAADPKTGQDEAAALLRAGDGDLHKQALAVLSERPEGAALAGRLFLEKRLPRESLPQVADALRTHLAGRPELERLLTEVMKGGLLVSLAPAEVERVRKLVAARGSARRGRELYLNSKALACVICHRLEGVGGQVGPDLTRVWDTHSVEKLIEAIIDPSKEIKEGYQTYMATTTDGRIFSGLKIAQNAAEVVLRDATGEDVRIAAKDLDKLTASKKSLMPDDVVRHLSFNQFLDLIAFLRDRKAQESLRGAARDFWVVGPFGGDFKTAHPPEKKPRPEARYEGGKLTWQPRQVDARGFLDLRAVAARAGDSAYALTYVHSARAQRATLLSGSGGGLRVWVNGKRVHEHTGSRPARADEDRVQVPLRAGWNAVLVRVLNEGSEPGLYLRFTGEGVRVALRPEKE